MEYDWLVSGIAMVGVLLAVIRYLDLRLARLERGMNERFAEAQQQRDASFAEMLRHTDARFAETQRHIDASFAQMLQNANERFAETQRHTDDRFAEMLRYFDAMWGPAHPGARVVKG